MNKILVIFGLTILTLSVFGCTAQDHNYDPLIMDTPTEESIIPTDEITRETNTYVDRITVSGTYVGLIDNNSFEAIIDTVPTAFRCNNCPDVIEKANISEGDNVTITYKENKYGQNIVVSIELNTELITSNLFPIELNIYKKYKGIGSEYAEYDSITEFATADKIQIKSNNGATIAVEVYEVTDKYVKKVYFEGEVYDVIDCTGKVNMDEIVLMAPIKVGTTWNVGDNKRTITAIDKTITTPYSQFKAVEVTTVYEDSTIRDYYVVNIGHVKTIFENNETQTQIISELETLEKGYVPKWSK